MDASFQTQIFLKGNDDKLDYWTALLGLNKKRWENKKR